MINWKLISKILGTLIWAEGAFMSLGLLLALCYQESDIMAFAIAVALAALAGMGLRLLGRHATSALSRRDAYLLVSVVWLAFTAFGMLPFLIGGYLHSVTVHQRAITKAEYEYELARRQASSEMGGLFTPQPSSLPTNIRCLTSRKHVIGYVGCSLNTSDYRFFLDAKDFYIYRPQKEDARKWIINPDEKECWRMVVNGMFLCIWEDERDSGGDLTTGWARRNQLDVRLKGAYIVKPWFWED